MVVIELDAWRSVSLISILLIPPGYAVSHGAMQGRVCLRHPCNRSDAFECLIDFLSKVSQVLGTNSPDNRFFLIG